jgi:hypothetical protein
MLEADLDLNLAGGTYTFQVQCHDYETPPSEICRFDAADLQVPDTAEYGGVAFLNPRLRLLRESSAAAVR